VPALMVLAGVSSALAFPGSAARGRRLPFQPRPYALASSTGVSTIVASGFAFLVLRMNRFQIEVGQNVSVENHRGSRIKSSQTVGASVPIGCGSTVYSI